jgi:hypothetical protein
LKLISEGTLSEEHAWTLFRQILEAVVHISSLGIVCKTLSAIGVTLMWF